MRWSDRKIEEFERMSRLSLLKKFIIIGECRLKTKMDNDDEADLVADMNDVDYNSPSRRPSLPYKTKPFVLLYNI